MITSRARRRMAGLMLLVLASLPLAQGCVAVAVGAVAGAAAGVTYTVLGVAEKTFGEEYEVVEPALQKALATLDIKTGDIRKTEKNGRVVSTEIEAFSRDLTIRITLERVTDKTTRAVVDASRGYLIKDKAAATQILTETTNNLPRKT